MVELGVGVVVLIVVVSVLISRARRGTVVYAWEHGLLYEDGVFKKVLEPGRYHQHLFGPKRLIVTVPRHTQFAHSGQVDVLTADRFPLRLSAHVAYFATDVRRASEEKLGERVVFAAREALTAAAAARTLESLLAERIELGAPLAAQISGVLPDAEVTSASISQLTLPPEIRRLVVEVERAKLEGQAALERARGEHAALRALGNAARLMKDNPELASLRTLQAVASAKNATLVVGQAAFGSGASEAGLPPGSPSRT